MSTSLFKVNSHTLPCQHIREYPGATSKSQEDVLQLCVKQYTPLSNPSPSPGDITIIGAHANAFPKVLSPPPFPSVTHLTPPQELYEPLWDEILSRGASHGFKIRSIWIADVAHQGASGILNEALLGNDRTRPSPPPLSNRLTSSLTCTPNLQPPGSTTRATSSR